MAKNHIFIEKRKTNERKLIIYDIFEVVYYIFGGNKMGKYTQDVKDKAVEMVKQGVSLKEIQRQLGPNPKAVERYLAKAGIEKPKVVRQPTEKKERSPKVAKSAKKGKDVVVEEKVITEDFDDEF